MVAPQRWWLLRHAVPVVPAAVRVGAGPAAALAPPSRWCYGHSDWPADACATQSAAHAWHRAWRASPQPGQQQPLRVRCSTLQRCKQLAFEIQALEPDFIVIFDDRLREINFGQWEGQLWDDVPRHELDAWAKDFAHHRLGHTGECVQAWAHRVWAAAREDLTHGDDTLWITHAGVMRAAQVWLQAGCPTHLAVGSASAWPPQAPPHGSGVIWTRHGQCAPWEQA